MASISCQIERRNWGGDGKGESMETEERGETC